MAITSPAPVRGAAVVFLAALLLASNASAEYFVVPTDKELVTAADAIVIGTVLGMHSAYNIDGVLTTYLDIDPDTVLKGDLEPRQTIRVAEPGGVIGTRFMLVSAAPTYWIHNRALLFLHRLPDGNWRTYGAPLGKFDFVTDTTGRDLAVRWATEADGAPDTLWTGDGHPHEEQLRESLRFLVWIQQVVRLTAKHELEQRPLPETPEPDYFVESPPTALSTPQGWDPATNATYPPSAYTNGNFRWYDFDEGKSVTFRTSGTQPGFDSVGAAQRGMAAWNNDTGSNVNYLYGGTSTDGFVEDEKNTIVFNSATGVPAGAIGYAQWFGGCDPHPAPCPPLYKGEEFYRIVEADVVFKQNLGISQKVFDEAVTHELGHTLGFRHSDAGTPSSTQAVMTSTLTGNFGATLAQWDIDAVRTVYTSGGGGTTPGIPANLVATATSTTSITITWSLATLATGYRLERSTNNSTWTQIATPTGTSFTDTGRTPGVTYVYRVRATGPGGTSGYSNRDHATTILFTDDPLVAGVTVIKAVHLTQLRQAVNAVRVAAGLGTVGWTDPSPTGVPVKAVHINELRSALTPALTALGKTASYTGTITPGTTIRAVHFQELRNLTK